MSTSSTTQAPTAATVGVASNGLSDTEWIIITVVLVIILVVLIIAIAKCLEIGKSNKGPKSLLNDGQSFRSETARSATTRSIASTKKSNGGAMTKMPLNAEITRFSAGRVSRSAEYGVVIKDIRKAVNTNDGRTSPLPIFQEPTNTLNTYRPSQQIEQPAVIVQEEPVILTRVPTPKHTPIMIRRNNTLTSPPNANLIVNQQYASQGLAPPNSRAVFVASDNGTYVNNTAARNPRMLTLQQQPMAAMPQVMQPMMLQQQPMQLDVRYLAQPTVIMQ